jgi:two-component system response regulator DesR
MGEAPEPPISRLTGTERKVLVLIVEGADTRTIASQLGIGRVAVRTHVARILSKLDVHSRLEAASRAVSAGFLGRIAPRPIRALIVDDHELFAEAIRAALLDADIEVAAVLRSGRDAVAYLEKHHPDVVLLDLGLPDRSGLAVGREIRESWPYAKLMVLTALDDPKAVEEAMRAGFRGYVTKDTPIAQLISAIRSVADQPSGSPFLRIGPEDEPLDGLSTLEWETLWLLADNADEATIAVRLGLPLKDIGAHVRRLLEKLRVGEVGDVLRRLGVEQPAGSDHPHPAPMDDVGLLAHLRFMHARGVQRYHLMDSAGLWRLHRLMHREPPPSPA